jgi:hypothetical protein
METGDGFAMSNVVEYLLNLAANPDRCQHFKADPESELRCADLTDSEKMALASREPRKITAAMDDSNPDPQRVWESLFSVSKDSGGLVDDQG